MYKHTHLSLPSRVYFFVTMLELMLQTISFVSGLGEEGDWPLVWKNAELECDTLCINPLFCVLWEKNLSLGPHHRPQGDVPFL